MSSTLYRKYRPKNFSEIIGQKHVVQTLSNAIKNSRVGQAYLFTGPRGTGKTSIARIFAKTINCQNLKDSITCEKCPACLGINEGKLLDIIEIDAASNTGVDNIRELRETVALPPTLLKYKVYIIDEVHMLSAGAFNALLKTLEEPPAHAVFILATTEIHKVPETIISRCQRFDFARLPIANIIEKLSLIARAEKVEIDQNSLEMIAIAAEGGMRDAESLLGQIIALEDKNITLKEVEEILGTTDRQSVFEISEDIVEKNPAGAIAKINRLLENGYDLEVFGKSLINHLRQLMLLKVNPELKEHFGYELTREQLEKMLRQAEKAELSRIVSAINLLLEAQGKIASFILPQLPLEIAIVKATDDGREIILEEEKEKPFKKSMASPIKEFPVNRVNSPTAIDDKKNPEEAPAEKTEINLGAIKKVWPRLLEEIKPYNHSLKALLSNCQPTGISGELLTISTPYDFYEARLKENGNRLTIEKVLGSILGSKIGVKIAVNKDLAAKKEPENESPVQKESSQDSLLSSALEIIGGKVVKE